MLIFLDEEKAYRYWVTHHRRCYVLSGSNRYDPQRMTLHRATCLEVRPPTNSRVHMTTGSHWKACAVTPQELMEWASGWNREPSICDACHPLDTALEVPEEIHLSKLGREILEYVLEAAVIHFDNDSPPYRLCAEDMAACFDSTVGRLSPALRSLFVQGLLTTSGATNHVARGSKIYPTSLALRQLPDFAGSSESELESELLKLRG